MENIKKNSIMSFLKKQQHIPQVFKANIKSLYAAVIYISMFFGCLFNFIYFLIFHGYRQCPTVRIQIRTDMLSVLIWFRTVSKSYQLMIKVATYDAGRGGKEFRKYLY